MEWLDYKHDKNDDKPYKEPHVKSDRIMHWYNNAHYGLVIVPFITEDKFCCFAYVSHKLADQYIH